jgi:PBP1b-binding outer membrane lipoprotein LpoB
MNYTPIIMKKILLLLFLIILITGCTQEIIQIEEVSEEKIEENVAVDIAVIHAEPEEPNLEDQGLE